MKKKIKWAVVLLFGLIFAYLVYFLVQPNEKHNVNSPSQEKQLWTCGMHPEIEQDHPGNCPICGMKLVPKRTSKGNQKERKILYYRSPMNPSITSPVPAKDEMGMDFVPVYEDEVGSNFVEIDPALLQRINVKYAKIVKRELSNTVLTNGFVAVDESREINVTTKVGGWVEKLYINKVGQSVKKGEKLLEIYSPEVVSAQQELLVTIESVNYKKELPNNLEDFGNQLIANIIRKLQYFDVDNSVIKEIIKTKSTKKTIPLFAMRGGVVLEKNILEGQKIEAGTKLFHIADLSILWILADVYEFELPKISLGGTAEITLPFLPGKKFYGKITFIYPTVEPQTRTAKVRIEIPNPSMQIKPGMYANVKLYGKKLKDVLVIPEDAVIRSGTNDIVLVSLGSGKFLAKEVKLGIYSEGFYQVLEGLEEGTEVVTSAQFLIDSESKLKSAIASFTPSRDTNQEKREKIGIETNALKMVKPESISKTTKVKKEKEESIVRKGEIDVVSIDKNKDGKVFQCPMHFNVIADAKKNCPICEMKLEEVTLEEAIKNLEDNGFKVKRGR